MHEQHRLGSVKDCTVPIVPSISDASSVVDPHHVDADPDSDFLFDADPDPDSSFKKRLKPLKKC